MGEDRLNCMARDPHWIHCYWELAGDALERVSKGREPRFLETVRWVLRVRAADEEPCDVDIDSASRSWYLRVGPGRRVGVELGLVTVGGDFLALVSGGEVETPPLRAAGAADRGPLRGELERLLAQGLVGSSANSHTSMSSRSRSVGASPGAAGSARVDGTAGCPDDAASKGGAGRT